MDYSISSGLITRSKSLKCHFLSGISNSCHGVTVIGIKPVQKNFDQKISIILGASPDQTLDTKEWAADTQFVLWPKFFHQFITNLCQTNDENFKKIPQMVFDWDLI